MSALTLQQALRAAHFELMEQDPRVFVMGEDVGVLGGAFGITQGLLARFGPERVRDAPISETAIIGAAIGAALVGMRPICEMQFVDFLFVALDQLLHQAALAHYASGGVNTVPLVIRARTDPVPGLPALPMTRARVLRRGDVVTCVAAGGMVRKALAAADRLAADKLTVEVIDLRCAMPLDQSTIIESTMHTGRVLVLDEAPRGGGLAAEVTALVAEAATASSRQILVRRLTAAPVPIAYAAHPAAATVPDVAAIATAMRDLAREPRS